MKNIAKTFDEICPIWYRAFTILVEQGITEYKKYKDKERLNISSLTHCVMGEANGFNDGYVVKHVDIRKETDVPYCRICRNLGYDFVGLCLDAERNEIKDFINHEAVKKLEEHWNEVHN